MPSVARQVKPKSNLAIVEGATAKSNGQAAASQSVSASPQTAPLNFGMSSAPAMAITSPTVVHPFNPPILPIPPVLGAGIRIEAKYRQLGGAGSFLGAAIGDVQASTDGRGFFKQFQGGSIYAGPGGTHEVHGAIRDRWLLLGAETGFLGYPISDETGTADGVGRFNNFQNGSIYWTPATGAHEVHGAIRDEWRALGSEQSIMGYPLTDETGTPDGVGRYNHFQSGSIYWTPGTGAHEVHGAIRDKWSSMGWERSFLGYPTSDEGDIATANGPGRMNTFENGNIIWTPATGALVTPASVHFHETLTSGLPLGGWVDLVLNANGDVTMSGHLHDSGFDNIDYTLSVVVVSPSGASVGFQHQGHTEGTSAAVPIFGSPNRDDDFVTPQGLNNQQIAAAWSQFRNGSLTWRLDATDTLTEGAGQMLGDLAQKALVALGTAATAALVALIFA